MSTYAQMFTVVLSASLLPEYCQFNLVGTEFMNVMIPVSSDVNACEICSVNQRTRSDNLISESSPNDAYETKRLSMMKNHATEKNYVPSKFVKKIQSPVHPIQYRSLPKFVHRRTFKSTAIVSEPKPCFKEQMAMHPQPTNTLFLTVPHNYITRNFGDDFSQPVAAAFQESIAFKPKNLPFLTVPNNYIEQNVGNDFSSNAPGINAEHPAGNEFTPFAESLSPLQVISQPVPMFPVPYAETPIIFKPLGDDLYVDLEVPVGTDIDNNILDTIFSIIKTFATTQDALNLRVSNVPKLNQEGYGSIHDVVKHNMPTKIIICPSSSTLATAPSPTPAQTPPTPAECPPTPTLIPAAPTQFPPTPARSPPTPAHSPLTPAQSLPTPAESPPTPTEAPSSPAQTPATPAEGGTCYAQSLKHLEQSFYEVTFQELLKKHSADRRENSISFVQSGLALHSLLSLLSSLDHVTLVQNGTCNFFNLPNNVKMSALRQTYRSLPHSDRELKFHWTTRIVFPKDYIVPKYFEERANEFGVPISHINETDNAENLMKILNEMVERDSDGAMHDTFEPEELARGACGVLLSTVYLRARWRSPPVLLNDTRAFRSAGDLPDAATRMIRLNDRMGHARMDDWDAEALEIPYSTAGLSLVVVRPRSASLRALARRVAARGLAAVLARLAPRRVAALLPLYTLRMNVLLPDKLHRMGFPGVLASPPGCARRGAFAVSHAVQRVMFWSEPGSNAFKDDGIDWDEKPDVEVVMDRPYLFFVRWNNLTLMNGHFAL